MLPNTPTVTLSLALIGGGLILWLLLRRSGVWWRVPVSFAAGAGLVLLMVPAVIGPMTNGANDDAPQASPDAVAEGTALPVEMTAAPIEASETPLVIYTAQPTRVALVLSPLPTRFVYLTPTATATLSHTDGSLRSQANAPPFFASA